MGYENMNGTNVTRGGTLDGQDIGYQGPGARCPPTHEDKAKEPKPHPPHSEHMRSATPNHSHRPPKEFDRASQQSRGRGDAAVDTRFASREPQQPFSLGRYLQENDQIEAYRRQGEGYPQGSPGMREYLRDWQRAWKNTSESDAR